MNHDTPSPDVNTYVVGLDDSAGALAALRWAMDEAELHHGAVRAVTAWVSGPPHPWTGAVREALAEASAAHPGIPLEHTQRTGDTARALAHAAEGARLLVVGGGRTAHECAHRAPCPVVVVPAARPGRHHLRGRTS
ncbi:universal stress protein [Actinokineospora bangkokensis]|uniref:UspA domain-containing protein n=1 Tax=Actinokineospora bangkokensis TaxID=1193682 RepID=A0A1Q9LR12_9PSEU|nr:universal stress protein [Actinokineospora bangkokensis]OLR94465.1 hypothetical protein BJP25_11980 [Actinokineospora bangkokensis]